jgi:deoxyribose-phosphate aldolase
MSTADRQNITRESLAAMIDHTLLKPEATEDAVAALCNEAVALDVFAVCVSPVFVATARALVPSSMNVAAVCGFPSGKHDSSVKGLEAALACHAGASEIDMVIDIGALLAHDYESVARDISTVRAASKNAVLKVILETAALSDELIYEGCMAAARSGADFVKTSTGFHPLGGATLEAVALMHDCVRGRLGVKASGGIKDLPTALAMVEAGATRLGLSSSSFVLNGFQ